MAPLKAERQTATVPQIWIVEIETPFFRRFSAPPPPVLMTTTSGPSLPSLAAVCALAFTFLTSLASADDVFDLVVVYPGGPNPGSSQQNVIDDFVSRLTGELSLTLKGTYFNDTEAAAAFLADHPNSFVFGSTGFFLAQREALSLVPELTVILPDEHPEQYFLVSRKGAFSDLASMKGKSIQFRIHTGRNQRIPAREGHTQEAAREEAGREGIAEKVRDEQEGGDSSGRTHSFLRRSSPVTRRHCFPGET